jgi:beta-lactamase regulating signal transducer with metallopeptidase domain
MPNDMIVLLLTQLWQITLLIVIVALTVRLAARNRPHLAHMLWMLVVIKCLTPPIWSSDYSLFSQLQEKASNPPAPVSSTDELRVEEPHPIPPAPAWAEESVEESLEEDSLIPEASQEAEMEDMEWFAAEASDSEQPVQETKTEYAVAPMKLIQNVSRSYGPNIILTIWGFGAGVVFLLSLRQGLRYAVKARRHSMAADAALTETTLRLAKTVRVRWKPKVRVVSDVSLSPAVMGLFRPTILLPERMLQEMSPKRIELILAHELIHVRRRDSWCGLLQIAAQAVWWFHPLVWRVGRQILHAADHCCDEAVLAELTCPPEEYADCLLDVIEYRMDVNVVSFPLIPGVGDVERTAQRLERIMKPRKGFLKRTPWWCWIVMLLLAAVVLPGARMIASNDATPSHVEDMFFLDSSGEAFTGYDILEQHNSGVDGRPRRIVEFDMDDLIEAIIEEEAESNPEILTPLSETAEIHRNEAEKLLLLVIFRIRAQWGEGSGDLNAWWNDGRLCVNETEEGIKTVEAILDALREDETSCVQVNTMFLEVTPDVKAMLGDRDWSALPLEEADRLKRQMLFPFDLRDETRGVRRLHIARPKVVSLTSEEAEIVREAVFGSGDTPRLQMRNMPLWEGRLGKAESLSQTPFVVDAYEVVGDFATAYQPVVEVVEEGFSVRAFGDSLEDGMVRVHLRLDRKEIIDVETHHLFGAEPIQETIVNQGDGTPLPSVSGTSVQCPNIETRRTDCTLVFKPGQSYLIALPDGENKSGQVLAALVSANSATSDFAVEFRMARLQIQRTRDMFNAVHDSQNGLDIPPAPEATVLR